MAGGGRERRPQPVPGLDQAGVGLSHAGDRGGIVDLALEPGAGRRAEDRPPDREAFAGRRARGARKARLQLVNGRIEAVGRSFHLTGDTTEHYALNVPETALREGRNRIEVFEITASGRLRALAVS